ncbi:MAG: 50S ribosomal protein L27 [Planctomycetaceae bacterium]|nr:50S ribosomal protein L27 [Planctomycetaceae bacterium]
MAHKKGQGSTSNGRDSNGQRRGVKKFGGEVVRPGNIIIRQVGTKFHPGRGVDMGKDYTIFAVIEGNVQFDRGGRRVNVVAASN